MPTVIDFQCLNGIDNRQIIKELAIVRTGEGKTHIGHYMFKPPYHSSYLNKDIYKTNKWVTHYNGLEWTKGSISMTEMGNVLAENIIWGQKVFVKGKQKQELLAKNFGIFATDLESLNCPKPDNLPEEIISCSLDHKICSLTQALKFLRWMQENDIR